VDRKSNIKTQMVLVDVGNEDLVEDDKNMIAVPASDGWMVIPQWASVVIVDEDGCYHFVLSYLDLNNLQAIFNS
jgi:hypothetical protein